MRTRWARPCTRIHAASQEVHVTLPPLPPLSASHRQRRRLPSSFHSPPLDPSRLPTVSGGVFPPPSTPPLSYPSRLPTVSGGVLSSCSPMYAGRQTGAVLLHAMYMDMYAGRQTGAASSRHIRWVGCGVLQRSQGVAAHPGEGGALIMPSGGWDGVAPLLGRQLGQVSRWSTAWPW